MLLSQLRWLGALAIGVAVMVAMYLDPAVEAPGGQPAPAPSFPPPAASAKPVPDEKARLDAYETARQALIENTPEGAVRDSALAALRAQYFPEPVAQTPPAGAERPESP